MPIILLEFPNASQPRQSPNQLIPMQRTKISETNRQILIRLLDEIKHHAMPRTIHRFKPKLLTPVINPENVLPVFEVMSRDFPQLGIIDIWRYYLLITSNSVLLSY
jgi:hypothetical protein